ncbi:hypothetical protein BH09PSE5_BH09PSE5_17980 [soil metagenome]
MTDQFELDPMRRAIRLLGQAADWPSAASALYALEVRWQAPARGLLIEGREATLQQLQSDASLFAAGDQVVLRRTLAGDRVIDETATSFVVPEGGIAGLDLPTGCCVELTRTRVLRFAAGLIVDELNVETWTRL